MNIADVPMTMEKILNLAKLNMPGLEEIEDRIRSILAKADGIVKEMCMSLLMSGGKRIRPLIVIYSGMCFSELTPAMMFTAVASELIHMASLVHDDIIDSAESRRGIRTINSAYGNHFAVLAGDFLFAEAFSILSSHKLIKSMEYLVDAIREMCDGEINQAGDGFRMGVTMEDYFKRIRKKTGILISSCSKAGAAAAGASDYYIDLMDNYGTNLGNAYQIIDDILDFIGDEAKLGKPTGMDLLNGNITLPVIILMEDLKYGPLANEIIKSRNLTRQDVGKITEMLIKSGAIKKSYSIAQECIDKAKLSLSYVPDTPYKSMLIYMADKVINRNC